MLTYKYLPEVKKYDKEVYISEAFILTKKTSKLRDYYSV